MKTKGAYFAKAAFLFIFIMMKFNVAFTQVTPYPQNLTIENVTFNNSNHEYYYPTSIVSPETATNTVNITGTSQVGYTAGREIILKEGFTTSGLSGNGYYIGKIDTGLDMILISPDPSTSIINGTVHVNKWEKFEIGFNLPDEYIKAVNRFFNHYYNYDGLNNPVNSITDINPYASDSLNVEINLVSPSSIYKRKWAFFMRQAHWASQNDDAQLADDPSNPLHPYNWHFRFAPDEDNVSVPWSFSITISNPQNLSGFPTYTFSGFSFMCDAPLADNHGFLHVNTNNNRNLQFDDGTPFFGIGENMAEHNHDFWQANTDPNLYYRMYKRDHDEMLQTLEETHSAGGNSSSLFLIKSDFAPEFHNLGVYDDYTAPFWTCPLISCCHPPGGITGNRQYMSWAFDKLIDKAREQNIFFELTVAPFAPIVAYQTFIWGDESYVRKYVYPGQSPPYNNTEEFFVSSGVADPANDGVMYYWKRKYKYILSRWGYSDNIAMIETFREIDQTLGFYETTPNDAVCNGSNVHYNINPNLKTAITNWHNYMFDYLRNPSYPNGLNDNHLYTMSFTDNGIYIHSPQNLQPNQYYDLYYNIPGLDVVDIHHYFDGIGMFENSFNVANYQVHGINNPNQLNIDKPFRFGEFSTFESMSQVSTLTTNAFNRFNNYEISFHNELWASSMMGLATSGYTWFCGLVHRWDDTSPGVNIINPNPNPYPPGNLGVSFTVPLTGGGSLTETYNSYYHNYKRLSEFAQLINFNENHSPQKFYDQSNGVESYYLVNSNQENAFGWVHNLNFFWQNRYYYDANHNNNFCTASSIQSFIITGFYSNEQYSVDFYPTRLGTQSLPTSYIATADNTGNIVIDLSTNPLGCDSTSADYAYAVYHINAGHRVAYNKTPLAVKQTKKNKYEPAVYPNPNNGLFTCLIPYEKQSNAEIEIYDLTGNIIYSKKNISKNVLSVNIADKAKGIYFLMVKTNQFSKTLKLIIQ